MPKVESSTEAPQVVNGQAESIAPQGADGNVQLAASAVVQPLGGMQQQISPTVANQQVVVAANTQVSTAAIPAAIQPDLVKLGE